MKIPVLDHGYVEFVEAWGQGKDGYESQECAIDQGTEFEHDYERGIVEAARQSTQGSFRGWAEDAKLLKFLYSKHHDTPFEFAGMVIEVQAPIFVFREWHRHRTQSYNEMSARYEPLPELYYIPNWEHIKERSEKGAGHLNKQQQGSKVITEQEAVNAECTITGCYNECERAYQAMLVNGVPKELARLVMPVGHYSRMRASANLRNWLAFLTLRMDPAAQWEIRQFASAVANIISQTFPRTYQLFIDRVNGLT